MPKINVYLPDELATAVRVARVPVSSICQTALERAVRDVNALRGAVVPPDSDYEPGQPAKPFSRFTPRARHAVVLAQKAANATPHNYIGTEHLLLGLLDEGENLALKVLASLDIEVDDLRVEIDAALGPATLPGPDPEHLPFTALLKSVLEKAAHEALALGHNYIGCEHLLMGLLAEEQGVASQVLRRMGVDFRGDEARRDRRAQRVRARSRNAGDRERHHAVLARGDPPPPRGARATPSELRFRSELRGRRARLRRSGRRRTRRRRCPRRPASSRGRSGRGHAGDGRVEVQRARATPRTARPPNENTLPSEPTSQ